MIDCNSLCLESRSQTEISTSGKWFAGIKSNNVVPGETPAAMQHGNNSASDKLEGYVSATVLLVSLLCCWITCVQIHQDVG